jgi:hypothetical protein
MRNEIELTTEELELVVGGVTGVEPVVIIPDAPPAPETTCGTRGPLAGPGRVW